MKKLSLTPFESTSLFTFAKNRKFILEVGTGYTTCILARAAAISKFTQMTTIDIKENFNIEKFSNVTYLIGFSITQGDMITKGHPQFVHSQYKGVLDEASAFGRSVIKEPCDLIRKACQGKELDFYFGDSGEYSGLAEWDIVKDLIILHGFIALHDIHYPKSSKNFQVYDIIRKSDNWHIHLKTYSKAGFMIAEKIKI